MSPMGCAWLASAVCFGFAQAILPGLEQAAATARTASSPALLRRETQEQAAEEVDTGAALVEQVVHKHSIRLENHVQGDVAEEAATNVQTCSGSWSMACVQEYLQSADLTTVLAKADVYDGVFVLLHPAAKAAFALAEWRQSQQTANADTKSSEEADAAILTEQPTSGSAKQPPKKQRQGSSIAGAVTLTIFALIFAYLYQQKVTFKRKQGPLTTEDPDFNADFSLAETDMPWCPNCAKCDLQYCLHSCCCMPSRLGDTHQQLGVAGCIPCFGPFWSVAVGWLLITNFAIFARRFLPMPFGGFGQGFVHFLLDLMFAYYLACQRHTLREQLGYKGASNMCIDTMLYLCCLPCTTFNDAVQIDGAARTKVWCCFGVEVLNKDNTASSGPFIGDPVEVVAEEKKPEGTADAPAADAPAPAADAPAA